MNKITLTKFSLATKAVLLALVVSSCGGSSTDNASRLDSDACDVIPEINSADANPRIVSGTQCEPIGSAFVKYVVSNDQGSYICSGTLITNNKVLTVAHCLTGEIVGFDLKPENVAVEGIDISGNPFSVPVSAIDNHPAFLPQITQEVLDTIDDFEPKITNDLAVITLAEPLENVVTVPLGLSSDLDKGEIIKIFGFGFTENDEVGTLHSGEMIIQDVEPELIAASSTEEKGSSICFGDSGGPVIYKAKSGYGIVGVHSFDDGEGDECVLNTLTFSTKLNTETNLSFLDAVAPGYKVN